MKYIITLVLALFLYAPAINAQSEDKWEEFAERLSRKAERIAEQVERQAELTASKWEREAERIADRLERQWGRNPRITVRNFPDEVSVECCPEVFLGIEASDISKQKAQKLGFENPYGSYVSKVFENTAAAAAGLKPFDYVYGINEQRTSNNQNLSDIMEDFEPGQEVTIHYIRNGSQQTAKAQLTENQDFDFSSDMGERAFLGVSPGENEEEEDVNGVTVEVVKNSTADEMGLKNGDVIVAMNGRTILDWDDLTTFISNSKPGDAIEVVYTRDGKEMKANKALKAYHEVYPESGEMGYSDKNEDFNWDEEYEDGDDWKGEGAFLGVYIESISEEKAKKLGFDNPYGSYVSGIIKGSAAEKAGLQPLDYIFGIDEYRVGQNQSLTGILKKYKPDDKATVHFIRKSQKTKAEVVFTSHFTARENEKEKNSCEDPFLGINQRSTDAMMDTDGVKISPVKNSTASELGLEDGDVITSINGYRMADWTDISTAIDLLKPGETITVEYLRNGKAMKASKPIKSYAETKNCKNCDCDDERNVVISVNPQERYNFNIRSNTKSDTKSERVNITNAKVSVEELTSSDASSLQSKGLIPSSTSSLTVENLALTPDSAQGMFKLEFRLPSSGNTIVKVLNSSGRAIYEYELGKFSGTFSDNIDISQNGPGNYFLQITQENKVFNKKIVLQGS